MDERQLLLQDYFRLRVLLNRANKTANEKTDIRFFIKDFQKNRIYFVASITGVTNGAFIQLCTCRTPYRWESSNVSGLKILEEFCSNRLQHYQDNLGVSKTQKLTDLQKESICDQITEELRSLGISKQ